MSTRTRRTCAILLALVFAFGQYVASISSPLRAATPAGRWELLPAYGGDIQEIVALPSSASTLVAVDWWNGIFRSTDGAHWMPANAGVDSWRMGSVVVTPLGVLFAGSYGRGVFRSTDGGASWKVASQGAGTGILHMAADPGSASTVYATGGSSITRTTDGGDTWSACAALPDGTYVYALAVGPGSPGIVCLGTETGALTSTDGGAHWNPWHVSSGTSTRVVRFAFSGSTVFAAAVGGLYRRTSPDAEWIKLGGSLVGLGSFRCVGVAADDPRVVYAGSSSQKGLFRSSDLGDTWVLCNSSIGDIRPETILAQSAQSVWVAAGGAGMYHSTDGGLSWTPASTGMTGLVVESLSVQQASQTKLWVGTHGGVYVSGDAGATWKNATTGALAYEVYATSAQAGTILAGTWSGGIFRSTDGGTTWNHVLGAGYTIRSFLVTGFPSASLYAGAWKTLYRSVDDGKTWKAMTTTFIGDTYVTTLVTGSQAGTMFAGTSGNGVFLSDDDGSTWRPVNNGLVSPSVNRLVMVAGRLYACTNSGVCVLKGDGTAWEALSPVTSGRETYAFTASGSKLFVACSGTALYSGDGGLTWSNEVTGLGGATIKTLDTVDGVVYAGATNGVYRWSPVVRYHVSVSIGGEQVGASLDGDATQEVEDGQSAVFKVTVNTGFDVTVSHGSYDKDKGIWTIPTVHGDVAGVITVKRTESAFTAVLVIGNRTMLAGNQMVQLEAAPYIKGGRTMLPLRAVSEAFGGDITWDPVERKVTVKLGGHTVLLWIGKAQAEVDGRKTPIDAANTTVVPEIVAGRTFVPLRFVAESTGLDVTWNADARSVTIRRT
ncbi:MAG: stalk domain-containing protein [Caldiserica bacterium]|nr:stalk domain-containing protein [Caldisericota bacterium]